ncbi:hypothetical protein ACFLT9_01535 [Acidobacteriota bacterium]
MRNLALAEGVKRNWPKILLLLLYCPMSCFIVGMTACFLRLRGTLAIGANYSFSDVFWYYAIPYPGIYTEMHLFTLAFSMILLSFLLISANSSDHKRHIFHIRILLLVLLTVITLITKIFIVTIPADGGYAALNGLKLFLFVDLDLILLFLLTYLPAFKPKRIQSAE